MRIYSVPGAVSVCVQVTFVLGWATTLHMSQILTISEAVLDLGEAFGAGMVLAGMSRVGDKNRIHVKSFCPSRLIADEEALGMYDKWGRL